MTPAPVCPDCGCDSLHVVNPFGSCFIECQNHGCHWTSGAISDDLLIAAGLEENGRRLLRETF